MTVSSSKAWLYAQAHAHEPLSKIANDLGVGYSTLDRWVRQASQNQSSTRPLSAEQQRIVELEREVKRLREANDILKKVHVYWLKEHDKVSTRS